jgi:hypothetical protein
MLGGSPPLLLASELDDKSGLMFDRKARAILPSSWADAPAVARLIAASEALVARWM